MTTPVKFQITKDGNPIDGFLLVTGMDKNLKLDLFAKLETEASSHIVTIALDATAGDKLVDEILNWL